MSAVGAYAALVLVLVVLSMTMYQAGARETWRDAYSSGFSNGVAVMGTACRAAIETSR